ncbi:hypothetical protein CKA32_006543 [Geitlerinema sp. FC II]|nr:hypothetical protein CKA32_006543 [Geitlerinema sp. FC II]
MKTDKPLKILSRQIDDLTWKISKPRARGVLFDGSLTRG